MILPTHIGWQDKYNNERSIKKLKEQVTNVNTTNSQRDLSSSHSFEQLLQSEIKVHHQRIKAVN